MGVIKIFIQFIELVVFLYLGFAAVYLFVFAVAGIFPQKKNNKHITKLRKFAVLIPGYKEDQVIVEVAKKALQQDFPTAFYEVVVIADSFQPETLQQLKALPIKLVEVSFEKSTKSKALNKAMQVIGDAYDVALILDADNVMAKDFISKINKAFDLGYRVVQGHRVAKNLNTSFAVLDAISEEVNNQIFRKGHRNLGYSSALIGSGMAFEYSFFKSTMKAVNAVGGFDKELELKLLKAKQQIAYVNDALVLDEKVQHVEVFEQQRKRWLSAQFVYFRRYFVSGCKELWMNGNLDFFDKVYQMITPPRVLLLGWVSMITFIYAALNLMGLESSTFIHSTWWLSVFVLTVMALLLAIPKKFYNAFTLLAVLKLPQAFLSMLFSLFKLKGANRKFIHTQHGTIDH